MPVSGLDRIACARLADFSTFRLGGPCRVLADCSTPAAVVDAVRDARGHAIPHVLMGGGSNVLVSDEGYDGVVIRYAETDLAIVRTGDVLDIPAAIRLDDAARFAAGQGLDGLTCCTGIPGTVGGAIAGNAGAWGRQIADCIRDVTVLGEDGRETTLSVGELGFSYRRSRLQQGGRFVLSARLAMTPGDPTQLAEERVRILALRADKHPDPATAPCIGSIFRNIEPTSAAGRRQAAGWFLEEAGAKALTEGGAAVFEKHANIIVAREGCRAQHVRDLASRMAASVRQRFGIALVREVRYLGRFAGEDLHPGFF